MQKNEISRSVFAITCIIGVCAGLVSIIIEKSVHYVSHHFNTHTQYDAISFIFSICAIGLAGIICTRFMPNALGSGIPRTKLALSVHHGVIKTKEWGTKIIATILTLSTGVPLGIEGPTIAISGGIGSSIARRFYTDEILIKKLIYVGCSAGIAAAFNTPIAAVIFTLEEMVGNLNAKSMGPILISSLIASVTASALKGQNSLFTVTNYGFQHSTELVFYVLLGLVAGFMGPLFVKNIIGTKKLTKRFFKHHRITPMIIGVILTAAVSLIEPRILGSGVKVINDVLQGVPFTSEILLQLILLKFLVAAFCYGCGMSGGILLPTMFVGALLGGLFGNAVNLIYADNSIQLGAYALVGMGAFFAAVIKTPFTSIILVFEMTRDYRIVLPLMIANMIAYFLAEKQFYGSIYEYMSTAEGIDLPTHEEDELHHMSIDDLYIPDRGVLDKPVAYKDMIYPDQPISVALIKLRHLKFKKNLIVLNRLNPLEKLGSLSFKDVISHLEKTPADID